MQVLGQCSNCPALAEDAFCAAGGVATPCFGLMWGDAG